MDLSQLKAVRHAATDLAIKSVDWASDQFPSDDYDPSAVGQVTVKFVVQGPTLARLLGKQERVLPEALSEVNSRKALSYLRGGPVAAQILKSVTPSVQKLVVQTAGDRFGRGVRGVRVDYSDETTYWEARVDQPSQQIVYEIDLDVLWSWI